VPAVSPDGAAPYPDGGAVLPQAGAPLDPVKEEKDKNSLVPKTKEAPPSPTGKIRFQADPVGDGATLSVSLGFGLLSQIVLSTGEIRPQQIAATFDTQSLVALDRIAINQKVSETAASYSNYGVYAAVAFAIADPILTGIREDSRQAALVDGVIYAEAIGVTYAVTNLAKVTVRRPRPYAYIEFNKHRDDPNYNNADTDSSLSFFSGHTATLAAISSAATYLAFARAGDGARPWVTLVAGSAATTFVAIERVRAGQHFPTDVIAGAMAGGGIGLLVAHMHREDTAKQRPVWIGFTPLDLSGGLATIGGEF
jgi:undecaprenyl-diphosphatase